MVGMAYCLEIHGWLADRADRHRRAAWLLGAADPLWERAGGRLGGTAALLQVHEDAMGKTRAAALAASGSTRCSPRPDGTRSTRWSRSPSPTPTTPAIRRRPLARPAGQLTYREAEIADLAGQGHVQPADRGAPVHLQAHRRRAP